ncbi:MAG TPA: hypothetical protein VH234_00155 [Candidatus Saccharimonadales bacterium]|jgi:metal-responsive CopG/Arc/MetJ family transcriptional regulator|nr:hypothetical protein [Candidatus Saccharimonadales bacterium]
MKTIKIDFKISNELLKQLDQAARASFSTRSNFIRECIVLRLRGHETIKKEQDEFLERLRRISEQD